MAKKSVIDDERVVFFFGKKRKLNDNDEFKVGRLTVRAFTELVGQPEGNWYAELTAYDENVTIHGPLGRSPAAAVKKLERRVQTLYYALKNVIVSSDV